MPSGDRGCVSALTACYPSWAPLTSARSFATSGDDPARTHPPQTAHPPTPVRPPPTLPRNRTSRGGGHPPATLAPHPRNPSTTAPGTGTLDPASPITGHLAPVGGTEMVDRRCPQGLGSIPAGNLHWSTDATCQLNHWKQICIAGKQDQCGEDLAHRGLNHIYRDLDIYSLFHRRVVWPSTVGKWAPHHLNSGVPPLPLVRLLSVRRRRFRFKARVGQATVDADNLDLCILLATCCDQICDQ